MIYNIKSWNFQKYLRWNKGLSKPSSHINNLYADSYWSTDINLKE